MIDRTSTPGGSDVVDEKVRLQQGKMRTNETLCLALVAGQLNIRNCLFVCAGLTWKALGLERSCATQPETFNRLQKLAGKCRKGRRFHYAPVLIAFI
jgi:hypothetical protein